MEETMGGSRTAVTWHPSDRRPQEPSIACQILLRGLLEGVRSSCKSYLVRTPGFTGQGFILICSPRLVLKVLLRFGLLLFPVLELVANTQIWSDISLQIKGSTATPTLQMRTCINKQPHMERQLESGTAPDKGKGKGKSKEFRDSLPSALKKSSKKCLLGSKWERWKCREARSSSHC